MTTQKDKPEDEIIGNAYRTLKKLVKEYAKNDLPVLFYGESGTGKELFARLYMSSSERSGKKRSGKMMTLNCATYSDDLLRSEIFGHAKGAFTGAMENREGKIKKCKDGILFLDELGDASQEFQAAILRVAEGNSFTAVGSDDEIININTRIIAATLKPGQIRQDLKERFHLLPVPPLQKADIPIIAKHFLGNRSLKKEILIDLLSCEYPSNVRSLRKYCESLLAEKGESIFSNNPVTHTTHDNNDFDYQRYRLELKTWEKRIQPLLDKLKITTIKYKYMPWDSNVINEPNWEHYKDGVYEAKLMVEGYYAYESYNANLGGNRLDFYRKSTIQLMDELKNKVTKESEEKFVLHLRKFFSDNTLPLLLETLQKKEDANKDEPKINFPAMSSLLDYPLREAESEFKKRYAEYNLSRDESNPGELEEKTGTTRDNLLQIIRRSKASKTK